MFNNKMLVLFVSANILRQKTVLSSFDGQGQQVIVHTSKDLHGHSEEIMR